MPNQKQILHDTLLTVQAEIRSLMETETELIRMINMNNQPEEAEGRKGRIPPAEPVKVKPVKMERKKIRSLQTREAQIISLFLERENAPMHRTEIAEAVDMSLGYASTLLSMSSSTQSDGLGYWNLHPKVYAGLKHKAL